jgi:hypothetical protein
MAKLSKTDNKLPRLEAKQKLRNRIKFNEIVQITQTLILLYLLYQSL